ncbi:hypothetical protein [Streptomyces sp. LaPpAH-108]|uniref:hypothetical protein n=1 Tax=Streptomyces sp. LaPpAH-108 TaxID=1155714 RepID=UPI00036F1B2C|nr:hypothetical protein [Streptomyces sp. LaPpAH-108]
MRLTPELVRLPRPPEVVHEDVPAVLVRFPGGQLLRRLRGANGAEPNTLADIYGSTWITSGAGSVISLWGEAGDPIVSLRHLKQPFAEVGPFRLLHDHTTGTATVHHTADLVALAGASRGGISALDAAKAIFETEKPSAAQKEKARRRLAKLVEAGQLEAKTGPAGAGTVYRAPSGALF